MQPWRPQVFSRGGQWGDMKDGSPSAGFRGSSLVGGWRHFLKMMHKYFVYWGFSSKKHFNISRGKCPLCPCLRAPMNATSFLWSECFPAWQGGDDQTISLCPPLLHRRLRQQNHCWRFRSLLLLLAITSVVQRAGVSDWRSVSCHWWLTCELRRVRIAMNDDLQLHLCCRHFDIMCVILQSAVHKCCTHRPHTAERIRRKINRLTVNTFTIKLQ